MHDVKLQEWKFLDCEKCMMRLIQDVWKQARNNPGWVDCNIWKLQDMNFAGLLTWGIGSFHVCNFAENQDFEKYMQDIMQDIKGVGQVHFVLENL